MPKNVNLEHGRKLLTAVERVLAPTDDLIALVAQHEEKARASASSPAEVRKRASKTLIRHYSNRAAVVGAASTLTGTIPGVGTAVALLSGAVLDATLLLKWEVEMVLALSHLHGFDIEENAERQLAFLMASIGTYDAQSGKNFVVDVLAAEQEALWNYTPRMLGKQVVTVLAYLALLRLGRGIIRVLPLVGPVVGAASNKVVTRRVGERCQLDFETRRELLASPRSRAVRPIPKTATKRRTPSKAARARPARRSSKASQPE